MKQEEQHGFDKKWESDVYGAGRQLNLYPFDVVVGFVARNFSRVNDRKDVKILDVGCGAGNHAWYLAREGFSVFGIDGSASAISFAKSRLAKDGLSAELVVGDITDMDWNDTGFDFVLDRGSITHNRRNDVIRTLAKIGQMLKPGGLFLSQMFSTRHASREFGRDLGDGSYDNFSGGYFHDIALTFFAGLDDFEELYPDTLKITSIQHVLSEIPGDPASTSAFWNVSAVSTRATD